MKTLNLLNLSLPLFAMTLLSPLSALASDAHLRSNPVSSTKIVHSKIVELSVSLTPENVRLSRAGYSLPVVKVFIPEIAEHTLLNHRNFGAEAPCMATFETTLPADVIADRPGVESHEFSIVLKKHARLSKDAEDNNICYLRLEETIKSNIRGFNFAHSRTMSLEERPVADCL